MVMKLIPGGTRISDRALVSVPDLAVGVAELMQFPQRRVIICALRREWDAGALQDEQMSLRRKSFRRD